MTETEKQMELGKLTKAVRLCKMYIKSNEELSEESPKDIYDSFKEDSLTCEYILNILMDYGIDKYGPEFDEAVKD